MWRVRITAIFLAAAAMASFSGCGSKESETAMLTQNAEAKTANYRTAVAEEGNLIKTSELSLEPKYYLGQTIYCPESGLYFDSFSVSRGQFVKKGELIATFTRKGSVADLEESYLAVLRAHDEYVETQEKLEQKWVEARSKGAIYEELAELELEQYRYNQTVKINALDKAYMEAQAAFEPEYIYAPFDCIVHSLGSFDTGSEVDKGKEIAELKQADSLVLFSSTTAKNFLYNMDVTVEYGRRDERKTVTARVVATDAVLPDGVAGSGHTYFKLDGDITEDELNKPSASVTTVQAQDALLVPRGAVEVEDGSYYVSVLEGDMVKKRYVIRGITGGTVGESATVILAGIKSGQTVILN
ncbi:MAG: efflux RND transporter periplasmic adaptor subunit [Ruminococcaceae bacterium]|nr:efflux RND transporter periplasmic adaptor subunit [Oscillospiraceae bacterium]